MKDNYKTKVIFRKFKEGDIIALLSDEKTWRKKDITCYQHYGQHTECNSNIVNITSPANESEYIELKKELESLGYNLLIQRRLKHEI